MQGRIRRTAAAGAAAFVLAGSITLAVPTGTAYADTISARCGDTVTAKPGDKISTPFGLQTVIDGITSLVGGLLNGLCKITVNIVDTAVAPVVGQPTADTINGAVSSTTGNVTKTISGAGDALAGGSTPPAQGKPSPGGGTPVAGKPQTGPAATIPGPNSPVVGQDPVSLPVLPFESTGYAPARDYSDLPYAPAALWSPSPGIRYGDGIPGYAPESTTLGVDQSPGKIVQNTGRAQALAGAPAQDRFPLGVPALAAVIALSAVAAALTRTWVQRNAH
ncbi:hypothetical protein [Amycolatopsis taiwanensis]|uniref:hypothetical protein n=1 Tax=Amycolatopsis taiwanensis TaxID=342230 RepID=UPI000480B18F|nr:hypothetical protein [Amycolatopsis taiwanensis]